MTAGDGVSDGIDSPARVGWPLEVEPMGSVGLWGLRILFLGVRV